MLEMSRLHFIRLRFFDGSGGWMELGIASLNQQFPVKRRIHHPIRNAIEIGA